jgi:hypothetical protein
MGDGEWSDEHTDTAFCGWSYIGKCIGADEYFECPICGTNDVHWGCFMEAVVDGYETIMGDDFGPEHFNSPICWHCSEDLGIMKHQQQMHLLTGGEGGEGSEGSEGSEGGEGGEGGDASKQPLSEPTVGTTAPPTLAPFHRFLAAHLHSVETR